MKNIKTGEMLEHDRFVEKSLGMPLHKAKKMNLGSGWDYREGWVNADVNEKFKKDAYVNLEKLPLPFEDNSFDYIFTSHTLEHIRRELFGVFLELWRVLKPGGILEVRVPHYSSGSALTSIGHKQAFSIGGFYGFYENSALDCVPGFPKLQRPLFKKLRGRLKYQRTDDGEHLLVRRSFVYYGSKIISFFASLNVTVCEKVWCYWFGGFPEMQIMMQKIPQDVKFEKGYYDKIIN